MFIKIFFSCFVAFVLISPIRSQLIYINGASFKLVTGVQIPVDLKFSGGSLSWFTNLQAFYTLPDNVTYFEPYRVVQKRSVKNTFTRFTVYKALDKYFKGLGILGNECIHQLICNVSRKKLMGGLFGDLTQRLFSPNKDLHSGLKEHREAFWQGLHNASACEKIYQDCSVPGNSFLFKWLK